MSTATSTPAAPAPEQLIDLPEVARRLAAGVSTLRRYQALGLLPRPVRVAGLVRWRSGEIDAWISAGCPAADEWDQLRRATK